MPKPPPSITNSSSPRDAELISHAVRRGFVIRDDLRQALPTHALKHAIDEKADEKSRWRWTNTLVDMIKHSDRMSIEVERLSLDSAVAAEAVDVRAVIDGLYADENYVEFVRTRACDADAGAAGKVVQRRALGDGKASGVCGPGDHEDDAG